MSFKIFAAAAKNNNLLFKILLYHFKSLSTASKLQLTQPFEVST